MAKLETKLSLLVPEKLSFQKCWTFTWRQRSITKDKSRTLLEKLTVKSCHCCTRRSNVGVHLKRIVKFCHVPQTTINNLMIWMCKCQPGTEKREQRLSHRPWQAGTCATCMQINTHNTQSPHMHKGIHIMYVNRNTLINVHTCLAVHTEPSMLKCIHMSMHGNTHHSWI